MRVAVVGGGFVGLSTALLLRRAGHSVTLIDGAAGGVLSASHGNAGTFAAYACVHINRPGLVWDVPRMLASSKSPLSLVPSIHLLRMLPWFAHFLRNCRPDRVQATSMALGSILVRAEAAYDDVWAAAGVHVDDNMGRFARGPPAAASLPFSSRNGYLLLQKTQSMMRASQSAAVTRRQCVAGLRMEALTTSEVLQLEPNLSPEAAVGGSWFFPDGWGLREPGALLRALASGFEAAGGEMRCGTRATALLPKHDGVTIVLDGSSNVEVDQVVVACGAHSSTLAASIGDWIPLDTERGYHIEFKEGSQAVFTRAVCDPSQGYISSPMSGGLRSAGLVELGGTIAPPTPARYDQLELATRSMLNPEAASALGPSVKSADWLGFRPTMPDALPVIGRSTRAPNIIYAFRHQHVGWTLRLGQWAVSQVSL
jgi:glycine/D-amino acid oxidase-like deaminating enzyme